MNINVLMKQAKKMQDEMGKAQKQLQEKEYEASVQNGSVQVHASGTGTIQSIIIADELMNVENKEITQDLVIMAVNQVLEEIAKDREEMNNQITGGVNLPGFF